MEKKYRELFDGVHASERLRTEVRNMKHEQTKRIHKIPRAALAAAVLAIALAGTALAAEYFGWLKSARPLEASELYNANTTAGYRTEIEYGRIPVESLSPEALEWISSLPGTEERPFDSQSFDSWQDAENFLGLELADNALLEGMARKDSSFGYEYGEVCSSGPCLVMSEGPAGLTEVLSRYLDGEYEIMQTALLQFACAGEEGPATMRSTIEGMGSFRTETYQAVNGLEAVLLIEEDAADAGANIYASFLQNGTLFKLCVKGGSAEGAAAEMKLVLDAYE